MQPAKGGNGRRVGESAGGRESLGAGRRKGGLVEGEAGRERGREGGKEE